MDEKTSPSEAAVWSSFPGDLLHRADNKDIRKSSQQCNDRHNDEGDEESSGVIDDESRHCRRGDAGKISDAKLRGRQAQLPLQQGRGDGEVAAIDVIDKGGKGQ